MPGGTGRGLTTIVLGAVGLGCTCEACLVASGVHPDDTRPKAPRTTRAGTATVVTDLG